MAKKSKAQKSESEENSGSESEAAEELDSLKDELEALKEESKAHQDEPVTGKRRLTRQEKDALPKKTTKAKVKQELSSSEDESMEVEESKETAR